ncbi:MAG: NAD(P)/FAD-dependent oxidoreductase, partial [Candidatus Hadarchaeales archaeon]
CKLRGARIFAPTGSYAEVGGEGVYGYIIHRSGYERWLAEQIVGEGGEVKTKFRVTKSLLCGMAEDYDYVVGADGIAGATREFLGLGKPPLDDLHVAVEDLAEGDAGDDVVELHFGSVAPKGYAWIFPTGEDGLFRVGLGVPLSERLNARKLLDKFHKTVGTTPVGEIGAKLIPTAKPPKRLVYGNVLLVGDAGLQTDPVTGGGIVNAMVGAKCLARAIAEGKPENYDKYWKERLYLTNLLRYQLKRVLYDFTDEDFNELVRCAEGFNPSLRFGLGFALAQAVFHLMMKNPSLVIRKRFFRRVLNPRNT